MLSLELLDWLRSMVETIYHGKIDLTTMFSILNDNPSFWIYLSLNFHVLSKNPPENHFWRSKVPVYPQLINKNFPPLSRMSDSENVCRPLGGAERNPNRSA